MKSMHGHRYNWHPDLPDKRDHYVKFLQPTTIPQSVDLRTQMSAVEDQGSLGSCTANAWAAIVEKVAGIS